ncbi:MAG: hypothetical protein ACRBB0_10275 [Pelagimonas sp.]|uniref:hypothetical protein n=1 Tax=Pelagimonas sp. TaxID=2073170 RepID=UPI003D6AC13D
MLFARCLCLALVPLPVLADPCHDELAYILAKPLYANVPYEASASGKIGNMASITHQLFMSDTHSLITTIEPKGMPDTLFYNGGTYHPDGNGGWKLLYSTDLDAYVKGLKTTRKAQSENILEAYCERVEIDGKAYEIVSGTIDIVPPWQSQLEVEYMIATDTGLPKTFIYAYEMNGQPALSRFDYTARPDLELPTP